MIDLTDIFVNLLNGLPPLFIWFNITLYCIVMSLSTNLGNGECAHWQPVILLNAIITTLCGFFSPLLNPVCVFNLKMVKNIISLVSQIYYSLDYLIYDCHEKLIVAFDAWQFG